MSLNFKLCMTLTNVGKILIIGLIVLFTESCDLSESCSYKEINRKTSKDGKVDALITEVNCGATSSYSYRVNIVPKDSDITDDYVYLSDKTSGLDISWKGIKNLSITYNEARIFKFTNFWQSKEVDNFHYIVSITESNSENKNE